MWGTWCHKLLVQFSHSSYPHTAHNGWQTTKCVGWRIGRVTAAWGIRFPTSHDADSARIPGVYLLKYKHVGLLILSTTQWCSTTREVITTAVHWKHWSYYPGESVKHQQLIKLVLESKWLNGQRPCCWQKLWYWQRSKVTFNYLISAFLTSLQNYVM